MFKKLGKFIQLPNAIDRSHHSTNLSDRSHSSANGIPLISLLKSKLRVTNNSDNSDSRDLGKRLKVAEKRIELLEAQTQKLVAVLMCSSALTISMAASMGIDLKQLDKLLDSISKDFQ